MEPDVLPIARAMLGSDVRAVRRRTGRNSRVYQIEAAGETFALKLYPADGRERATREFAATSFFTRAGIARVPRPVAIDAAHRAAAYTWLAGEPVHHVTLADIDRLADFAAELHAARVSRTADEIRDASEACFDPASIVAQIDTRFERLAAVADEPALSGFLHDAFATVLATYRSVCAPQIGGSRTLSPSDFGFHNALRTTTGDVAFLDFEYFGWDDPVKLVADVCWHPGMGLESTLCRRFVARCAEIYREDAAFHDRFERSYVLFGLRWCLIVLNEFLPEFRERRIVGARADGPWTRRQQLAKAYTLLERCGAGCPA